VSEQRKHDERRDADAAKPEPACDRPQPKTQDEALNEQALDDVLRECPL
jgi:hypothetical protein